ncbi:hypothetical protein [Leeuwenhoekiella sp. MAR_2009_132]|uniref:hypothetical protein n=1 Tax=Leeuwenhoekiella sp. MAR_2009_132 TaxID=1392489 RepID=UPI00048D8E76|nr:hypothetical protein [Leeuwenhoekiella sp. MAR_2009_132]
MDLESKTKLVRELITFIQENDNYQNQDDIRSVTAYSFYQISESFMIGLILSENLSDLQYCKEKINPAIDDSYLPVLEYVFDGFLKDSFFIKLFALAENHIRQIAEFYESSTNKIKVDSISTTFKNLMNSNKTLFFSNLNIKDKELFDFYCYLRNTIHNMGFQSKPDQQLIINDASSVINKNKVIIDLTLNSANSLDFEKSILLQEQIFKLILKMNNVIPESDCIEHKLVSIGFNS